MDRTTRTVILTLIYLTITISLLVSAFIAMWRDQPDISLIALVAMVAMAVVTDKVNDRCRDLVEWCSKGKRAGAQE